jgi:hypothetical protein
VLPVGDPEVLVLAHSLRTNAECVRGTLKVFVTPVRKQDPAEQAGHKERVNTQRESKHAEGANNTRSLINLILQLS